MKNLVEKSARQAYEHARALVEGIGPRGSTTAAERQAAEYFEEQLGALELEVERQAFSSPKSAWLPFGLCILLSLVGLWFAWIGGLAIWIGLLLSGLAVYWAVREANLDDTLLNRRLHFGSSQNHWSVIAPRSQVERRLVLVAHLDSHRTPLIMHSKFFSAIFGVFSALGYAGLAVVPVYLGFLGFMGFLAFTGLERSLPVILILTAILGVLLVLVLQADFTPYSPGANDNAAAVGMALAFARHFRTNPLANTEVWILGTGCEEVGCYGMRRFLDRCGEKLREAYFIDFELVGRGLPASVDKEGLLFKQRGDRYLLEIAGGASEELGYAMKLQVSPVYGEGYILSKRRFAAITLSTMPEGKPDAYWHTPRDTLDKLDLESLGRVFTWTKLICEQVDRDAGESRS